MKGCSVWSYWSYAKSVHVFGGFKIQGRSGEQADKIVAEAIALEAAGVHCIVIECVPSALAQRITEAVQFLSSASVLVFIPTVKF